MAAALAAGADLICTNNIAHFPGPIMEDLGLGVMTPDDLFCHLFEVQAAVMLRVHRTTVLRFFQATDASTIEALRKAQAPRTANKVAALVNPGTED